MCTATHTVCVPPPLWHGVRVQPLSGPGLRSGDRCSTDVMGNSVQWKCAEGLRCVLICFCLGWVEAEAVSYAWGRSRSRSRTPLTETNSLNLSSQLQLLQRSSPQQLSSSSSIFLSFSSLSLYPSLSLSPFPTSSVALSSSCHSSLTELHPPRSSGPSLSLPLPPSPNSEHRGN